MNLIQIPNTIKQLVVSRARNRLLWRTPPRIRQDKVPTVVPCCGENLDVINDTIKARIVLDYPLDKFRIYVEGLVTESQKWTSKLSPVHTVYAPRQRKHQHLKTANFNLSLEFARRSTQRPGDFVVLYIDIIPPPAQFRAQVPSSR